MDGRVTATRDGRCTHIVLDRPARKNALTAAMLEQLIGAVDELATDATTDVVVINGAGTDFCTGSDVGDIAALLALDAGGRKAAFEKAMSNTVHPLMRSIMELPQVVVVSVRGHAVGLGAALILAADLAVLSKPARISLPQVALGHTVDHGESFLLPRKVGPVRAMQMVLLGERVTGTEAERFGLANAVVADGALDERTAELVSALLAGSPSSLRGSKWLVARSLERDRGAQFAAEVHAVSECAYSKEFATAIEATIGGRA